MNAPNSAESIDSTTTTTTTTTETNTNEAVSDIGLKYFCQKCSSTIDFFLNECQSKSDKSMKYKQLMSDYKKHFLSYKRKFDELEFEYEEVKALKDEYEDQLKKSQRICLHDSDMGDQDPSRGNQDSIVLFDSTRINRPLVVLEQHSNVTTVKNEATIHLNLDMSYFKKQNVRMLPVENLEKLFAQFAKVFSQNCGQTATTPTAAASMAANAIEWSNKLAKALPNQCPCSLKIDYNTQTTNTETETTTVPREDCAAKLSASQM